MGAQHIKCLLPLLLGLIGWTHLLGQGGNCEYTVDFDLEVQVVMDTVLYDGFEDPNELFPFPDVPAGMRRYRLYAVLPDEDYLMIGLASDGSINTDSTVCEAIPAFGYDASPGECYNWSGIFAPDGIDLAWEINSFWENSSAELQFDTWWTSHFTSSTGSAGAVFGEGDFTGYDICSDTLTDHAIVTIPTSAIHDQVTDGRALIGQITTDEDFRFKGCVNFLDGIGGASYVSCTDGWLEVEDLCAPMIDPQTEVMATIDCFGEEATILVTPNDPAQSFTSTVQYSLFEVTGGGDQLVTQQVGNPEFTNLGAGEYYVTLLDTSRTAAWSSNTCMDTTANFTFVEPSAIELNATLTADNLCGGEDVATMCFSTSGGTGTVQTTASHAFIPVLAPDTSGCFGPLSCFNGDGDYTITSTDDNGCIVDTVLTVSCPEPFFLDASNTEISCTGESDASLTVSVSGGTGWVTLEVPQIGASIDFEGSAEYEQDNLGSGTYTFLLIDENACQYEDSLTIEEPEGLAVSYTSTDVACADDCNGLILSDISGGQLPYLVTLNDLDGNEANPGQLCPGSYVHITSDGNGCEVVDTLQILAPDSIGFVFAVSNVPCSGADNGLICIDSLTGGTGPLSPTLVPLPTNSFDGDCFNVPAGTYSVLVQDSIGCTSESFQAVVEEPANIQILPTVTPISCTGANDGVLVIDAVGGSGSLELLAPFEFPSLPDTLSALGADSLNLVVGDTLGCIDSLVVTIPEPEPVDLDILSTVFPECGGDCTGGIELAIAGGTGALTLYEGVVSDSTSYIASGFVNLCADTYTIYLVDDNECTDSATVIIEEPDPLLFDITVQNVTCTGMNDGVVIVGTTGGSGETAWEFVGEDVDVLNLFEGEYFVSAVDTAGCTADSSFIVAADIVTDMVVEIFTSPVTCWQTSDGTATAAVTGGQPPIQYVWSDPAGQSTATAIGLDEDVYSVVVTDDIGCTLGFLATVEPTEDCLFIADALTPNGDGLNDRWVIGGLEFFPESEVEVFNRWGQLLFRSKPGTTWWDGTYNGALLPASDYYYVITVFAGAAPITGTVTLKY